MADKRPYAKIDDSLSKGIEIDDIPALKGNFVYTVVWPDGVVKVGYASVRSRWRTFVCRNARLVRLFAFTDQAAAFAAEDEAHHWMRASFPYAFRDRREAAPYLGSTGGGWTECYKTDGSIYVR